MGISAAAAYTSSDRTNDQMTQTNARGDKAEAWTAGLKYDANNIYLATMYSETRNMTPYGNDGVANKTQNFEVTAQYQFDFGLRPAISYLQSKGKDLYNNGRYADKDLVKYMDVGATYYFNRNMSTYVDYKINLLDETTASTKTTVSLPITSSRWAWFTSSDAPARRFRRAFPHPLQIKQNNISGLK
jgi:outer membrane protein N